MGELDIYVHSVVPRSGGGTGLGTRLRYSILHLDPLAYVIMKVAVCEQDETTSMKIVIHKFMNLNQSESDDEPGG